jgi:hypothetical protein
LSVARTSRISKRASSAKIGETQIEFPFGFVVVLGRGDCWRFGNISLLVGTQLKSEEFLRVLNSLGSKCCQTHPAKVRDECGGLANDGGFAPFSKVLRRGEKRGIAFHHDSIDRDRFGGLSHFAGIFKRHDSGERNEMAEIDYFLCLRRLFWSGPLTCKRESARSWNIVRICTLHPGAESKESLLLCRMRPGNRNTF